MVYFIQEGDRSVFKIGWSSESPKDRLTKLQVGNSSELFLVGTISGDRVFEKDLHRSLHKKHIRGEWFKVSIKEIKSLITKHSKGDPNHGLSAGNFGNSDNGGKIETSSPHKPLTPKDIKEMTREDALAIIKDIQTPVNYGGGLSDRQQDLLLRAEIVLGAA